MMLERGPVDVCRLILILLLATLILPLPNVLAMEEFDQPQAGMFLIAGPNMPDPRFRETVILLVSHSWMGTQGLIINRKTKASLSEMLDEPENENAKAHPVYFGGPVGLGKMVFLVRHDKSLEQARPVLEDIYLSGAPTLLEQMLPHKSEQELRVYIGYSGWGPGQLEAEMERGDWHLLPANSEPIFSPNPDSVWPELNPQDPGMIVQNAPFHSQVQLATF